MYYLLASGLVLIIFRYFNLIPSLSNKFWKYVDYLLLISAFVTLLSRIPPFFSGILLSAVVFFAWRKGWLDNFR
ncbi:hypothetical protein OAH54_03375 [Acidimicrobiia bacterium]|nr:hypothetical protein [Acidimicrobiia bacterium]